MERPIRRNDMNLTEILEMTDIRLATDDEQIRSCYKVMNQLRPHLNSEQEFVEQVQRQIQEGYHLAYIEDNGEIKALAGFRFLEFLAWGKVIYIDDLVSDTATRRNGYGSKILKWVVNEAKKANCDQVHLDSGPQRHDAHKLYLNHGFKIIGHHFALDLKA
jgi:GNAT superfamily N-acetyltransferase